MDSSLDQSMEYVSLAGSNRELYSNSAGDFANSGEIEKYMPKMMELISQSSGLGMNPLQPGMATAQAGMPPAQAHPAAGGSEAASSGINAARNSQGQQASAMQEQSPGKMGMPANTGDNPGNIPQYHMPKKQVLTEPCTISQPMNASLRDSFSTGTFYFLK